jgi:hypothetical protein
MAEWLKEVFKEVDRQYEKMSDLRKMSDDQGCQRAKAAEVPAPVLEPRHEL